MTVMIKILCPGRKCGKCRRMMQKVEETANLFGIEAKIEIINTIDEMLEYRTWIIPTLIINDVIVARGYVPSIEKIQEHLIK